MAIDYKRQCACKFYSGSFDIALDGFIISNRFNKVAGKFERKEKIALCKLERKGVPLMLSCELRIRSKTLQVGTHNRIAYSLFMCGRNMI